MGKSNSIINVGDLAKPATKLIEKISDAIGGIAKPYQIVRVAQAEAKAEKIRAATRIQVTDLERRAMRRFIMEEGKKQRNIETITAKALPDVGEQASPEKIEDDWITDFFDKCRLISDSEMQALWAKILAGEANSPGKFSKRTIGLLSSMDKSDASLFSNLCSFSFTRDLTYPLIYDVAGTMYIDRGINFTTLSHLESIGLIRFDNQQGFVRRDVPEEMTFDYFGEDVYVKLPAGANNNLRVGKAILTNVGEDLAPICGASACKGFSDYIRKEWTAFGYQTEKDNIPTVEESGKAAKKSHHS